MSGERKFRLQTDIPGKYIMIPWEYAELAYAEYVKKYGNSQSLVRIHERGGFGVEEIIKFLSWGIKRSKG